MFIEESVFLESVFLGSVDLSSLVFIRLFTVRNNASSARLERWCLARLITDSSHKRIEAMKGSKGQHFLVTFSALKPFVENHYTT